MLTHHATGRISRRNFLQVGVAGASSLTLASALRASEAGLGQKGKAHSVIFVHLAGGPSHLDTFDPKPEAPDGIRGEFNPIDTAVAGLQVSEHLPKLAASANRFSLIRGMSHALAAHDLGQRYVLSGNRPQPGLEYPNVGSVVTKELSVPAEIPGFVAVPQTNVGPGYLGVAFGPFDTNAVPKANQPFVVRGLTGPVKKSAQTSRKYKLLRSLDNRFGDFKSEDELLAGLDKFSQKAFAILHSPQTRQAFDVTRESTAIQERFGTTGLGMSCMLATRLIEAGTRFVTITNNGWDTHNDNFKRLKENQLPGLDQGISALLLTLEERGLLESTMVVVTGEFGRTPKINKRGGRDHWPRAMCMLVAGGGIKPGQVLGKSDAKGMGPDGTEIVPDDVTATIYHQLGIDYQIEYHTPTGRPVMLVRDGQAVSQLIG